MPDRLPSGLGRDCGSRRHLAQGFERRHPAQLAFQTSVATRRALPQDGPAARPRDNRWAHDVLVTGPPKNVRRQARAARQKMKKLRLDELLVARGYAESRAQAKALIMSGRVLR